MVETNEALGAQLHDDGTLFRVWAPRARSVSVVLDTQRVALQRRDDGVFSALVASAREGARYRFDVDGSVLMDPYARWLPEGIWAPAEVIRPPRPRRAPQPIDLEKAQAIYELHVGTFSPEGTYKGVQNKLAYLRELGVSVIELMPINAFAGQRGWGYDGVALYAPHAAYGTPSELRDLIDAAHEHGLSIILDVVLNHFGPDGNVLAAFSPTYFAPDRHTPWGAAPAFDEPHLRRMMIDLVRYWLDDYGFDGLRLDATHAIIDPSTKHVLRELSEVIPDRCVLIVEDERNDRMLLDEMHMDGMWADDFHHAMHVLLTGERHGYYQAFEPTLARLAQTLGRKDPHRLVSCLQNHDQIGNRAFGERLNHLVPKAVWEAASRFWLAMPMTPLLFMGQEWAAPEPFLYFTDHKPELGALIRDGRRREFSHSDLPDPQSAETFARSRLCWDEARDVTVHREALHRRARDPVLNRPGELALKTRVDGETLTVHMQSGTGERIVRWRFPDRVEIA